MESSNLIPHQHLASKARSKIVIGPQPKGGSPNVKLNKNGDKIESIEIKCACGETIVIQCEYPS